MSCREKQLEKDKLVRRLMGYIPPKFIGNGIARTARKRRAEYLIKREPFKIEYLRRNPTTNSNTAISLLRYANPKDQKFRHLTFYGIEEVEKIL